MAVFGPCFGCKKPFFFDPDLVQSIYIDPVTGLAPDMGGDADRAQREPVCPRCCALANPQRRRKGLPLLDERDSLDVARDRRR
jgi:hypothetical protein